MRVLLCFIIMSLSCSSFSQKDFIQQAGDGLQIALPSAAFVSTFIWRDGQNGPIQFVKTMGTSFIMTHTLKRVFDKERPDGGRHAFPSGHTTAAFTGAAFIQRRYGWKIGAPCYLLAGFVGYSRIHAKRHDIWDVTAGAILGTACAYLFTKPFKKVPKINLSYLAVSKSYLAIGLNYKF